MILFNSSLLTGYMMKLDVKVSCVIFIQRGKAACKESHFVVQLIEGTAIKRPFDILLIIFSLFTFSSEKVLDLCKMGPPPRF